MATTESDSRRKINIDLTPETKAGDWVLVNNNYAVSIIDEKRALDMIAMSHETRKAGDVNGC